jgi:hypothetical protein
MLDDPAVRLANAEENPEARRDRASDDTAGRQFVSDRCESTRGESDLSYLGVVEEMSLGEQTAELLQNEQALRKSGGFGSEGGEPRSYGELKLAPRWVELRNGDANALANGLAKSLLERRTEMACDRRRC